MHPYSQLSGKDTHKNVVFTNLRETFEAMQQYVHPPVRVSSDVFVGTLASLTYQVTRELDDRSSIGI